MCSLGKEINLLVREGKTKVQIKLASWRCLVLLAHFPESVLRISNTLIRSTYKMLKKKITWLKTSKKDVICSKNKTVALG